MRRDKSVCRNSSGNNQERIKKFDFATFPRMLIDEKKIFVRNKNSFA